MAGRNAPPQGKEVTSMKCTGIVRRIDDLGRVVIPKEIRRAMKIKEGDPLEIFTEPGGIVLKKYNPIPEVLESLRDARDAMDVDSPFFEEVCSLIERMEETEEAT